MLEFNYGFPGQIMRQKKFRDIEMSTDFFYMALTEGKLVQVHDPSDEKLQFLPQAKTLLSTKQFFLLVHVLKGKLRGIKHQLVFLKLSGIE